MSEHRSAIRGRRGDVAGWIPYVVVSAAAVLGFLPSVDILGSRYLAFRTTDVWLYFRHSIHFAVESLLAGQVPLWNPHILCGNPFLPSTCATLWYPPNWLPLFLLPQPLSLNVVIVLHVALLGLFTVYYARVRNCSNVAAGFAGVVMVYCSLATVRVPAGHFTIICTVAWIPMLFALQERMFTHGRRYIVPFAAAGACTFLAGHLQYVYYCLLFLTMNLVLTAFRQESRRQWFLRQAGYHATAGFIAFGLAAIEILPALDTMKYSVRGTARGTDWLGFFSMPPENFLTMISPGLFGPWLTYSGRFYWWETCFYIGIAPLILAVTAICRQVHARRLDNHTILLLIATALSVIGLLGPLAYIGYIIPGWTIFRGHAKILGIGAVLAVMLAAEGFDAVRRAPRGAAGKTALKVALFVAALGGICYLAAGSQRLWELFFASKARRIAPSNLSPAIEGLAGDAVGVAQAALLTTLVFAAAVVGLFLIRRRVRRPVLVWGTAVVTFLDLIVFAIPVSNTTFALADLPQPPPDMISFARRNQNAWRTDELNGVFMNDSMSLGYQSVGGCDFNVTKYWDTFISAYEGENKGFSRMNLTIRFDSPVLDCANLRYLMIPDAVPVPPGFDIKKSMNSGDVNLFERQSALPRAYVVGTAVWMPEEEPKLVAAMRAKPDFRRKVILCEPRVEVPGEDFDAVAATVDYSSDGLSVTAPRGGWLVICDAFYPHWRAWVNGAPRRIFRANGAFRAVQVSAGDRVVMRYVNPWFRTGAPVSGVAVVIAGIAFFILNRRRHDPDDSDSTPEVE